MKYTTARRIIKEGKKGKGHSPELIAEAHAACREHHAKLENEAKAINEIADQARVWIKDKPDITGGLTPEEFAKQQVKHGRQGRLDENLVAYKQGRRGVHPEGRFISNSSDKRNSNAMVVHPGQFPIRHS